MSLRSAHVHLYVFVVMKPTCQMFGDREVSMPAACAAALNNLVGNGKWLLQNCVKGCAVVVHGKLPERDR